MYRRQPVVDELPGGLLHVDLADADGLFLTIHLDVHISVAADRSV